MQEPISLEVKLDKLDKLVRKSVRNIVQVETRIISMATNETRVMRLSTDALLVLYIPTRI
jgi:hypothetical protein